MNTKKLMILFMSIVFGLCISTTTEPISLKRAIQWVRHKFTGSPVAGTLNTENIIVIPAVPQAPVVHVQRTVLFENNMRDFFDALSDDPAYAELPNLIDSTIIVNGKSLTPGSRAEITVQDGFGVVTIKLHKGIAKLIYAMQQGALKGVLMSLLKYVEPWLQWQYSVTFRINDDIDCVQLSDLVLAAYNKSLDENAVNHRFKWILVVDLSLNEVVDL
jgi:hypothetical protein